MVTGASGAAGAGVKSVDVSQLPLFPGAALGAYDIEIFAAQPFDLVVQTADSGGMGSFLVVEAIINNLTGTPITGLDLILGSGTIDPATGIDSFVPFTSGALDFGWEAGAIRNPDDTVADGNKGYDLDASPYVLSWSGATTYDGSDLSASYYLDVPDELTSFTIRHVALPEPGSLALFALAVTPLTRWRASRHR